MTTPRVRINKRGEIVLTLSVHEARMTGDALSEVIHLRVLGSRGTTATVLRAIDRGIKRTPTAEAVKEDTP